MGFLSNVFGKNLPYAKPRQNSRIGKSSAALFTQMRLGRFWVKFLGQR
jgi:hypothetical protein